MSRGNVLAQYKRNSVSYTPQGELPEKGRAITGLVVCNYWDLEPLDLLNILTLGCYPEVWIQGTFFLVAEWYKLLPIRVKYYNVHTLKKILTLLTRSNSNIYFLVMLELLIGFKLCKSFPLAIRKQNNTIIIIRKSIFYFKT